MEPISTTLLKPPNTSTNLTTPSAPQPGTGNAQWQNPQILTQILTTMRAEIVQEVRGLHLDFYNDISKRLANMEKLIVHIAKAQAKPEALVN